MHLNSSELLHKDLECIGEVEPPNERLYKFNGRLMVSNALEAAYRHASGDASTYDTTPQGMTVFPIAAENVLLRGARLKQTEFAHGLVVYAGMESKLQRNANKPRSKFSQV